jgi:hypothetical protein
VLLFRDRGEQCSTTALHVVCSHPGLLVAFHRMQNGCLSLLLCCIIPFQDSDHLWRLSPPAREALQVRFGVEVLLSSLLSLCFPVRQRLWRQPAGAYPVCSLSNFSQQQACASSLMDTMYRQLRPKQPTARSHDACHSRQSQSS